MVLMCSHSTPVSIYLGDMKIPDAYKGNKTKMTHEGMQKNDLMAFKRSLICFFVCRHTQKLSVVSKYRLPHCIRNSNSNKEVP